MKARKDILNVWTLGPSSSQEWTRCVYCGGSRNRLVEDYDGDSPIVFECRECNNRWRLTANHAVFAGIVLLG